MTVRSLWELGFELLGLNLSAWAELRGSGLDAVVVAVVNRGAWLNKGDRRS